MLDLIIRGGDVVTPQGVTQCDVAIKGETIAAVAAPGTLAAADATRVIDASGIGHAIGAMSRSSTSGIAHGRVSSSGKTWRVVFFGYGSLA